MQSNTLSRVQTPAERDELERMLALAPTSARRVREGLGNLLLLWAFALLLVVVLWWVLAWLMRKLTGVDYGWQSPVSVWVWGLVLPLCAAYASVSTWRWLRGWRDMRPDLRADLAAGTVQEERHRFEEVRRFQEPEHGGLIYFFRTADSQVFVFYDAESQDRGVQEQDPLASSFVPMSDLALVRAPRSGFVLHRTFSGGVLDAGEPAPLQLEPSDWPEHEAFCDIPWDRLDARLGHSSGTEATPA